MRHLTNALTTLTALGLAVSLVACNDTDDAADLDANQGAAETQQTASDWLADGEPTGAAALADAAGDAVLVRARIGGRAEPMSPDSPVFLVVDLSLKHCGELPGDNCPMPWDYCCEPRDSLTANSATVQLVDDAGSPLAVDLTQSLEPLDVVVIEGVVGPRPSPEVLTIKATKIHRATTEG